MSTSRLFLGNLPFNLQADELRHALHNAGHSPDDVKVITDRETGAGRGFAFADYPTAAAAENAKNQLHGMLVGGRPLRVDYATTRAPGSSSRPQSSPSAPRQDDWGEGEGKSKRGKGSRRGDRDGGSRW